MTEEHETHSTCDKRLKQKGGKAECCWCHPHGHCAFMVELKDNLDREFDEKFMPKGIKDEMGNIRSGLEPLPGITGNLSTIKDFIRSRDKRLKEKIDKLIAEGMLICHKAIKKDNRHQD